MNVPERGDVIILDGRPALVISPANFNRVFSLAFVAPITSKPKGHAFEIPLPKGSSVRGAAMVHQLKSLDWRARRAERSGKVSGDVVARAAEIIAEIVR